MSSEEVGRQCAKGLISQLDGKSGADKFLSDQLLSFFVFNTKNRMIVPEITGHVKSGIYVIEKFTDVRFKIEGNEIGIK